MAKDALGQTILHYFLGKVHNVKLRSRIVSFIISRFPALARERDNDGRLPLHVALEKFDRTRRWSVVTCLLHAYPEGLCIRNNDGKSPLDVACEKDLDLDIIYMLFRFNPVANLDHWRETAS